MTVCVTNSEKVMMDMKDRPELGMFSVEFVVAVVATLSFAICFIKFLVRV